MAAGSDHSRLGATGGFFKFFFVFSRFAFSFQLLVGFIIIIILVFISPVFWYVFIVISAMFSVYGTSIQRTGVRQEKAFFFITIFFSAWGLNNPRSPVFGPARTIPRTLLGAPGSNLTIAWWELGRPGNLKEFEGIRSYNIMNLGFLGEFLGDFIKETFQRKNDLSLVKKCSFFFRKILLFSSKFWLLSPQSRPALGHVPALTSALVFDLGIP